MLDAHRAGRTPVLVLDLVVYELGNVLLRSLREPADLVKQQLALLQHICVPFVHPASSWHPAATDLAAQHDLTFYDASWAAAAVALDCPLVTADGALLAAGLGISATQAAAALRQ